MSRTTNAVARKRRKKKVLKQAKGYFGRKHSSYRLANEQVMRSGSYAYRDRRARKREFRRLWIVRINAAARREGISYSSSSRPRPGRRRGEPQDACRHRRARSRGISPICRASPGGHRGVERTADTRDSRAAHSVDRPFSSGSDNMITSPQNAKLKLIRRLHARRERERSGLFIAEGEDLLEAAAAAGVEPETLVAGGRGARAARRGQHPRARAPARSGSTRSAGRARADACPCSLTG